MAWSSAATSAAGTGKSGKPCPRFTAPCSCASCDITLKMVVPTFGTWDWIISTRGASEERAFAIRVRWVTRAPMFPTRRHRPVTPRPAARACACARPGHRGRRRCARRRGPGMHDAGTRLDAARMIALLQAYLEAEYQWQHEGSWHDIVVGLPTPGLELA